MHITRRLRITALLVATLAAAAAGAADRANISIDFLPDGRCSVSARGETFHSQMTYTPAASSEATGQFRCAVPPVPNGTPVDLQVSLSPGARPWGSGEPPLTWVERDARWTGTATLATAPEVVVISDYSGTPAVHARWKRRGMIAAGLLGVAAIVFYAARRRATRRL